MIITHSGRTIDLLGDAHLGKPFIHGVPLHRRGDREKMVWADFERSVSQTPADFHINLGDLLDRPIVPYDVIVRAPRTYIRAAEREPETQFLILQGNHDVSRDLDTLSKSGKDITNLAFRLSLSQILTNKVFSAFIDDEIDASLDQDKLENCATRLSQSILIGHKPVPADYCIDLEAAHAPIR